MSSQNKPAVSEFFIGAIAGAAFTPWISGIGLVGIFLVAAVTGTLWSLGGHLNQAYRRAGVPAVIVTCVGLTLQPMTAEFALRLLVAYSVMFLATSLGYGVPSTQPPDEGSAIGKFWYRILKDLDKANFATRMTVGAVFGSAAFALGGPWMWMPVNVCAFGFAFVWLGFDR